MEAAAIPSPPSSPRLASEEAAGLASAAA